MSVRIVGSRSLRLFKDKKVVSLPLVAAEMRGVIREEGVIVLKWDGVSFEGGALAVIAYGGTAQVRYVRHGDECIR